MELKDLGIDEHLFEEALRNKEPGKLFQILEIRPHSMTEKGLNFFSDIFRVHIQYTVTSNEKKTETRSENWIIKMEPSEKIPLLMLREQDMFLVELSVLRDFLPKIKEFVKHQLSPNLYYGSSNPHILIMEDLKERGFIMKDRQKGLTFEHCRLVMEQLARLHAGSVAVFEKHPEMIERFKDGGIVTDKCSTLYMRMMEVSLLRMGTQMRKWPNEKCHSPAEKLIKLSETIGERCKEVNNYDEGEFCVLNHGDCWVNNMVFKENEKGQPTDLLLLDYQFSVYTSPCIDLLYFLNTCPEFGIKYDYDDRLLKIYLDKLEETMTDIGCKRKPPTMKELMEAIHKRRAHTVLAGVVLYFRMIANKEDTESFTTLYEKFGGETKMDVFKNPHAMKIAQKIFPIMDERGYFDFD
ncbi:hypothetical protein WN48_05397 [Eufriesea mexicana]|uniref:uncharacterized protein LOC108556138 n=1 Tax=Eufriesea mexicana TaxID=516756 RepID=UPI00083BFDAD|nr:PREDICTED: uncharacterized protein LOC108556138 [Eufriesea mexicana]XP_017767595.1 PREDICTED: uncharacterized protein LOC108556138 [Eufriesea mexicana]OAD60426.1 hypothetical protein WN48_05397 [Eufriesea mexicana]